MPAADRRDVPGDTQLMRDLHEMVLGDAVAVGDLGDGGEAVVLDGEIHQQAKRIVAIDGEPHGNSPRPIKKIYFTYCF